MGALHISLIVILIFFYPIWVKFGFFKEKRYLVGFEVTIFLASSSSNFQNSSIPNPVPFELDKGLAQL